MDEQIKHPRAGWGRVGISLGLLFIASSASAARGADALASIKSIGVIACMGHTAEIRQIGMTVFGNKDSQLSIVDWNLDDRLADDAAKALSPAYRVITAPLPSETLKDMRADSCKRLETRLKDAIKADTAPTVDAYLVLIKASQQLPYPSNQSVNGAGMYRRATLFSGAGSIVHLTYEANLIDARTGKLLKFHIMQLDKANSPTPPRSVRVAALSAVWSGEATEDEYPADAEAFTDDQKASLRRHLEDLADRSVGSTLSRMRLTDSR